MNRSEAAKLRWESPIYRQKVIDGLNKFFAITSKIYNKEIVLCKCGCETSISKYDKRGRQHVFLSGHQMRGRSFESRNKTSEALKKDWREQYEKRLAGVRKTAEKLKGRSWGRHTKEIKRKISESEKGKLVSLETRLKQRESRLRFADLYPEKEKARGEKTGDKLRGRKQSIEVVNAIKEKWKDPVCREKRLKQMLKFKSPNRPERRLMEIIEKNNLPYKFVGDGSLIIKGFNPDFVNCNGKKVLLEVFGDYWHNRPDWKKRDDIRLKEFESLGYKTLIFWEHEIVDRRKIKATLTEAQIVEILTRKNMFDWYKGDKHEVEK